MLTDSSLTNIFIVSGVSHIRYRVYCQQCERSQLARLLKSEAMPESSRLNHDWPRNHHENALIQAFRNLVQLNIPCVWRPAPANKDGEADDEPGSPRAADDIVSLELWVFWFDDRHTGMVDSNELLRQLEETKMGSFTWENTIAKGLSPTASPVSGSTSSAPASNAATVINRVSNEYKLFVKAVKHLIRSSILQRGALPLGEFFIFSSKSDTISDILPNTATTDSDTDSMLSCTYNIYLSNTNLIVQPDVRRFEIRPLTPTDLEDGTTVITCPLGERATILAKQRHIPQPFEEQVMREWSLLFDIPLRSCRHQRPCAAPKLPALTPIRSLRGDVILYPTVLLFVSTASATSPLSTAGMSGILRYHQGYTGDLGEQWNRWAWTDQVTNLTARGKPSQRLDYWNYGSPKAHTASAIFDSLAAAATTTEPSASSHGVLQKAITEQVGSSPIMASKAVATPASLGYKAETMSPSTLGDDSSSVRRQQQLESELSVADFARLHFADNKQMFESPEVKPEPGGVVQEVPASSAPETPPVPNNAIDGNGTSSGSGGGSGGGGYMDSSALLLSGGTTTDPVAAATSTNTANDTFDFRFGMDALDGSADNLYDMSNRWGDAMEDLDNLDLHVTEEDFDFFEREPISTTNAGTQQPQKQQQHPDFNDGLLETPPSPDFSRSLHQQQADGNDASDQPQQLMLMEAMPLSEIREVPEADNVPIDLDDLDALLGGSGGILGDHQLLVNHSTADVTTAATPGGAAAIATQCSPILTNCNSITATETTLGDDLAASLKQEKPASLISLKSVTTSPMLLESSIVENHYVPPDFAPVRFADGVDNAKYMDGGKFMYAPKKDGAITDDTTAGESRKRARRLKRSLYRPDYVPRLRKRIKNKDAHRSSGMQTYPAYTPTSIQSTYRTTTTPTPASPSPKPRSMIDEHASSSSSTSSTSSTSSDDDLSTSSDENDKDEIDSYSSQGQCTDAHDPEWWMSSLQSMHDSVVEQLLVASPSMRRRPVTGDDDVANGGKPDMRTTPSPDDFKVLEYFCQQVVMGGYPFTSGLAAVSANGGEVHIDESATALIARRRELLQRTHGVSNHVPSLSSDYHRISQDFKDVLMGVFDKSWTSAATTPDAVGTDGMLPMTVGGVAVKGPLSVQQYYDLSETSQAQSKYGKYQVRKRRPAEPNLDTLTPPDILVGRQDEYIEGSPKLVTMWEKLRLEPYSSRKNVVYFVVFPKNGQLESACGHFFKSLSTVYETCHLGAHHPGNISTYRRGLVPVPLLPPSSPNETWEESQLRSYSAECQNLGSALGSTMVERKHIVIYLVNPNNSAASHFDLSRCFHKLMVAYHAASMGVSTRSLQERRARLVMQLVPIEHVIRPSAFGGYTKFGLKDIAFSVYSKCLTVMSRDHVKPAVEDAWSAATMYAPPFILAKPAPDAIQFSLKGSANLFPTILESNATLHMAYTFTLDRRWMVIVWTDNHGELLEYTVRRIGDKPVPQVIDDAWQQTLDVSRRTGFEWTFVIAKVGLMFLDELQMWADCVPSEYKVAITCVDMESALRVSTSQQFPSQSQIMPVMEYPQTPGSSSANTPTPEAFSASIPSSVGGIKNDTASVSNSDAAAGGTRALLLNHRVAYSQRRSQVSEAWVGGLNDEADSNWMLPLATGYLIHMYPKSENPCREQFNNEPLVMDIHLLFNQTGHSAYSTLRNIIKRYHALAYVYTTPSSGSSLPLHVVLADRLERILSMINT